MPVTEKGNDTLVVWVDRLTKYVTVMACKEAHTAEDFAQYTIDAVIYKWGCPESFVSDRDVRCTSKFWKSVTQTLGAERWMSTAFHPQSDGQTERMNISLEEVLRHYVSYNQGDWDSHIQMAAFAINNSYQSSTKSTPFMLNLGRNPRVPTVLTEVTDLLERRFAMIRGTKSQAALRVTKQMYADLSKAKEYLRIAQQRQKSYADRKRVDKEFKVDDMVLLSTRNLKLKNDERTTARAKLLPKYIGPYKILERVGKVAYRIKLPERCRIHPVFHVSLLHAYNDPDKYPGAQMQACPLDWLDGDPTFEVERILDHRVLFTGGKRSVTYLVKWCGFGTLYDTWEPEYIPGMLDAYIAVHPIARVYDAHDKACMRTSMPRKSEKAKGRRTFGAPTIVLNSGAEGADTAATPPATAGGSVSAPVLQAAATAGSDRREPSVALAGGQPPCAEEEGQA